LRVEVDGTLDATPAQPGQMLATQAGEPAPHRRDRPVQLRGDRRATVTLRPGGEGGTDHRGRIRPPRQH
jgi:hypothetical protein